MPSGLAGQGCPSIAFSGEGIEIRQQFILVENAFWVLQVDYPASRTSLGE